MGADDCAGAHKASVSRRSPKQHSKPRGRGNDESCSLALRSLRPRRLVAAIPADPPLTAEPDTQAQFGATRQLALVGSQHLVSPCGAQSSQSLDRHQGSPGALRSGL